MKSNNSLKWLLHAVSVFNSVHSTLGGCNKGEYHALICVFFLVIVLKNESELIWVKVNNIYIPVCVVVQHFLCWVTLASYWLV